MLIKNSTELTALRDKARQAMEIRLDRPVDPSPENHITHRTLPSTHDHTYYNLNNAQ